MKKSLNRKRSRGPLFAAIAVVLFFGLFEIVCRFVFPGITGALPFWKFDNPHLEMSETYDHDPVLFWKLRPNNPGYQVNEQGFRGKSAPIKKEPGEFRVISLGDSCTFGVGPEPIDAKDTYPAILGKLLQKALPDRKVTVLNFGCPGYTSFQGKLLLKTKAIDYDPDVLTAYFGMNDAFPAMGFADADQRPMVQPPALPDSVYGVLRKCCLHEALVRAIYGARMSANKVAPEAERVPLPEYHENLDEILRVGTSRGLAVYFIDPPYLNEAGKVTRSDGNMHEPRIDIFTPFAQVQEDGGEPLFGPPDNIHPTKQGHKLIAQTLFDRLMKDRPWEK